MSQKTLLVALDGVPGALFNELYDAGRLPELRAACEDGLRIRNLLSTFPSDSMTCYPVALMGARVERLSIPAQTWFDRRAKRYYDLWDFFPLFRMRHRRSASSEKTSRTFAPSVPTLACGFPNIRGADLHIPPLNAAFGLGLSRLGLWWDRLALRLVPCALGSYQCVAYLAVSSDHLAHSLGRKGLELSLANFDAALGRLLRRVDFNLNLVVFSDHGNMPMKGFYNLTQAVRRAGFHISRRMAGPNDVVVSSTMLNYAHIYTNDRAASLGPRLALDPQIGVIAWRDGRGSCVSNAMGTAYITERNGRYAYTPDTGDPLHIAPWLPVGAYLAPTAWFEAASHASLPGGFRICQFLQNPRAGDIAISFDNGYCPPWSFAFNGKFRPSLRWPWFPYNHGGLHRSQSITFAVAKGDGFPRETRETALLEDFYSYLDAHLRTISR